MAAEGSVLSLFDNLEINFILFMGIAYLVYQKYKELRNK